MAVYMIRAGLAGDVKIGMAVDPRKRMMGMQTAQAAKLNLIRVLVGERDTEKALHARFASHRKTGEWFAFTPEMLAGDIGYKDLPIRKQGKGVWPDTPHGRMRALHEDIVLCLGGANAIGRCLGVPPWEVIGQDGIAEQYFPAVALMMCEAKYEHVTVDILLDVHKEYQAKREEERIARAKSEAAEWANITNARAEKAWIEKHGASAAWWDLRPENRSTPANGNAPPTDTVETTSPPSAVVKVA